MLHPLFSKKRTLVVGLATVSLSFSMSVVAGVTIDKTLNIYESGKCYAQDFGTVYKQSGFDRWLSFYGAVTDKGPAPTCSASSYSEDIWMSWDYDDNGENFHANYSDEPQINTRMILSSQDLRSFAGQGNEAGSDEATGWHIGDPAVMMGNSGTWYMFFDAQSCEAARLSKEGKPGSWNGIYVATTLNPFSGWQIRGKINLFVTQPQVNPVLPSAPAWPRAFKHPTTGKMYLYYNDPYLKIRVAEIIDDGVGLNDQLLNSSSVIPVGKSNTLGVYYDNGLYYGVASELISPNDPDNSFYKLVKYGPTSTFTDFTQAAKYDLLNTTGSYSDVMGISPVVGMDMNTAGERVYFWGRQKNGNDCIANQTRSMWMHKEEVLTWTGSSFSADQIPSGQSRGQDFSVPFTFGSVEVNTPSWSNNVGNLTLTLYKSSPSYIYADTVASPPIASKTFVNFADNAWLKLTFPPQPAGHYLWVLSGATEIVGIWKSYTSTYGGSAFVNGVPTSNFDYLTKVR